MIPIFLPPSPFPAVRQSAELTKVASGGQPLDVINAGDGTLPVAVSAAALIAFLLWPGRLFAMLGVDASTTAFGDYRYMARLVGVLSVVTVLWTGTTALVVAACEQAR